VAQVCRLTRTTWRRGQRSVEVQYAITSVPRELASAAQLLVWWRGHWRIENQLHWVRDVTFGEDGCRVQTGYAPQNLAAFRNAGISLLRFLGCGTIAKTLRLHACRVDLLLAKLGIHKL
jgi:predicted transposase YbfD/YdcC